MSISVFNLDRWGFIHHYEERDDGIYHVLRVADRGGESQKIIADLLGSTDFKADKSLFHPIAETNVVSMKTNLMSQNENSENFKRIFPGVKFYKVEDENSVTYDAKTVVLNTSFYTPKNQEKESYFKNGSVRVAEKSKSLFMRSLRHELGYGDSLNAETQKLVDAAIENGINLFNEGTINKDSLPIWMSFLRSEKYYLTTPDIENPIFKAIIAEADKLISFAMSPSTGRIRVKEDAFSLGDAPEKLIYSNFRFSNISMILGSMEPEKILNGYVAPATKEEAENTIAISSKGIIEVGRDTKNSMSFFVKTTDIPFSYKLGLAEKFLIPHGAMHSDGQLITNDFISVHELFRSRYETHKMLDSINDSFGKSGGISTGFISDELSESIIQANTSFFHKKDDNGNAIRRISIFMAEHNPGVKILKMESDFRKLTVNISKKIDRLSAELEDDFSLINESFSFGGQEDPEGWRAAIETSVKHYFESIRKLDANGFTDGYSEKILNSVMPGNEHIALIDEYANGDAELFGLSKKIIDLVKTNIEQYRNEFNRQKKEVARTSLLDGVDQIIATKGGETIMAAPHPDQVIDDDGRYLSDDELLSTGSEGKETISMEGDADVIAGQDKNKNVKHEDVGQKIGGARKDLYNNISMGNIDQLNFQEQVHYIKKSSIWPTPSYAEMVKNGMRPVDVYFVKYLRDAIEATPDKISASIHNGGKKGAAPKAANENDNKYWLTAIEFVRDKINSVKPNDKQDFSKAIEEIQNFLNAEIEGIESEHEHTNACALGNSFKKKFHFGGDVLRQYRRFDYYQEDQYNYSTAGYGDPERYFKGKLGLKASTNKTDALATESASVSSESQEIDGIIGNEDTAITSSGEMPEQGGDAAKPDDESNDDAGESAEKGKDGKKEYPYPPHLKSITRIGSDWRKGKDIQGEDLLTTFGFKGIEYGNWVSNSERQAVLNHAYDSFMDLAYAMGIPKENLSIISMNGSLSIGFGSRGKGRALAHYEPLREVINITKIKGAGSLAHELFHAIDHYIGKEMGFSDPRRMLFSDVFFNTKRMMASYLKELPARGMALALIDTVNAMKSKPRDENTVNDDIKTAKQEAAKYFDSWARSTAYNYIEIYEEKPEGFKLKYPEENIDLGLKVLEEFDLNDAKVQGRDIIAKIAIAHAMEQLGISDPDATKLKEVSDGIENQINKREKCVTMGARIINYLNNEIRKAKESTEETQTDFYKQAKLLDGKKMKSNPYWSTEKELAARSFETTIFDMLAADGLQNDYLVSGVAPLQFSDTERYRGNPIPEGEERKNIADCYKILIDEIRKYAELTSHAKESIVNSVSMAEGENADQELEEEALFSPS